MHHKETEEIIDDFALEVKKIEEEADKILNDAQAKKEEIIALAKTESISMIAKKQAEMEKKKEEKLKVQKDKIEEEKKELIKKNEKETDSFEKNSRKNIPAAVSLVMKKLEKKIEEF